MDARRLAGPQHAPPRGDVGQERPDDEVARAGALARPDDAQPAARPERPAAALVSGRAWVSLDLRQFAQADRLLRLRDLRGTPAERSVVHDRDRASLQDRVAEADARAALKLQPASKDAPSLLEAALRGQGKAAEADAVKAQRSR